MLQIELDPHTTESLFINHVMARCESFVAFMTSQGLEQLMYIGQEDPRNFTTSHRMGEFRVRTERVFVGYVAKL
jgi:hypothetical protein